VSPAITTPHQIPGFSTTFAFHKHLTKTFNKETKQKNTTSRKGSLNSLQILKKLPCLHNFTHLIVEFALFPCQEWDRKLFQNTQTSKHIQASLSGLATPTTCPAQSQQHAETDFPTSANSFLPESAGTAAKRLERR
jgi:hypothetical protein